MNGVFHVSPFTYHALLLALSAAAADWPAYMHDNQRSGVSDEQLDQALALAWVYPRTQPPARAWADEAKFDYYVGSARQQPLKPRLVFDGVNHVVAAGNLVFFGSCTEHTVNCLDATTGQLKWSFFTDGPVRLAPTFAGGRVYAGSDDGGAYCLEAATGALLWKYTAATDNRLLPNNGQFVSPFAVRSAVAVEDGVAYFAAGFLPSEGVYLCAVDALTGRRTTGRHWQQFFLNQLSLQGYVLLSPTRVYVPGSRSNPWYFDRATGALLGQCRSDALGTFALLAGNSLFYGPAARAGAAIREEGVAYYTGNALVVTTNCTYLLSDTSLCALARPSRTNVWTKPANYPYALILAGQTLYAGGQNEVAAFNAGNGEKLWTGRVRGQAGGLAVANGKLYVSTDAGLIHAFARDKAKSQSSWTLY
jgi:outer membrane protein assembly factor BamB